MSWRALAVVIAVAVVFPVSAAEEAGEPEDRFVLTISGGISLGAYDAGRNWVIMRDLHAHRSNRSDANEVLAAVTGASAGAINAFISALDWCAAEGTYDGSLSGNPYRDLWTNVTFDKLLPSSNGLRVDAAPYISADDRLNHPDGLLARNHANKEIIERLYQWYAHGKFRPGCNIPFGVVVTKVVPEREKLFGGHDFTYPLQTFYVPFRLVVDERGHAQLNQDHSRMDREIVFEGGGRKSTHRFDGKILTLPRQDELVFEQILAMLYASSAFPLAFGRVFAEHCAENDQGSKSADCKEGATQTSEFVDGGILDNVPVGFGLALAGNPEKGLKFYYVDSDVLEPGTRVSGVASSAEPPRRFDLLSQLSFADGLVGTARAAGRVRPILELCPKHDENDNDCSGRAIVATRSGPITGEMVGAFGAFFDRRFLTYDYALGVADALYTVTPHAEGERPTPQQVLAQAQKLGIADGSDAWREVRWLIEREPHKEVSKDFRAIHVALGRADTPDGPNFTIFAQELEREHFVPGDNRLLAAAMANPSEWYLGISRLAVSRMDDLESDTPLKPLVGMLDNYLQLNAPRNEWTWSPTLNRDLRGLPVQLGVEVIEGSIDFAWRPTRFGTKYDWEFPTGLIWDPGRADSHLQVQLGANLRFPGRAWRVGAGVRAFADLDRSGRDKRWYPGVALNFDYHSVVRLQVGYRDAPWGEQLAVTVLAYDILSLGRLFPRD